MIYSDFVDYIGKLSIDEHEEYEISGFSSGQHLKESAAEIENQISDEEDENPQAVVSVLTGKLNKDCLSPNDYNVNLLDVFNSSLSDEDVEILCASEMDNEHHMPTSGCQTPCSTAILESKHQLYRDEQNDNLEYFSITGFHARQSLMNTPVKSEEKVNCSEDLVYSSSDEDGCTDVGERFQVVSHCGGLPLGLRTLGSSFIGKKLDVWEDLLKKLETIPDTNILKKLEISYESLLDDDVKNIFLHIACFFDGEDHDYTVEILDACDMHAVVGIDHLVERCLLEIGLDNTVRMHRLVRQMGRYIVHRESPHEPGERSRLWRSEDCFGVLTEKTGTRKTKALAFNMQIDREDNSNGMDIVSDAFSRMQQLKFLQLKNVELSGSYKEFPKRLGWFA